MQGKLSLNLEALKTLEQIQDALNIINRGDDLPSSDTGDFLKADGVGVTDDDLYEDV